LIDVAEVHVYRCAGRSDGAFATGQITGVEGAGVSIVTLLGGYAFAHNRVTGIDDTFVVVFQWAFKGFEYALPCSWVTAIHGAEVVILALWSRVNTFTIFIHSWVTAVFALGFPADVRALTIDGVFTVFTTTLTDDGLAGVDAAAVSVVADLWLVGAVSCGFITAIIGARVTI